MSNSLPALLVASSLLIVSTASAQAISYPATAKRSVTDAYFGGRGKVEVVDDYRWLEAGGDPGVKDWITLQDTATRRYLDALPARVAIRDELKDLIGAAPVDRSNLAFAGGRLFALKQQPPKNQRMLVVLDGPEALDSERVVVDPNQRNDKGTTAIDWFVPSRDGRLVAVSLSDNGSEKGTLRIFDVASGNELSDIIPRVQNPTGGGSVAWNADNSGLWYTRYPAPLERPKEDAGFYQQVYFHKLGTRSTFDTLAFGKDLPRIAEIRLESSDDGRWIMAEVLDGDGGQAAIWLRGPDDAWRQVAAFDDGFHKATFGRDGRLYAVGLKGSPRGRVVAMKPDVASLSSAATVVPQSETAIEAMLPTAKRIYLEVSTGGPTELRCYTMAGKPVPMPAAEPVSSVRLGSRLAGDTLVYSSESFVTSPQWNVIDPRRNGGKPVRTALSDTQDASVLAGVSVARVTATSRDGTPVPISLVVPRGLQLDGANPLLLTAYGGYGLSQKPRFARRNAFWLRHGGVLALAHVRGGNEFGDAWHQAGKLANKQNVFDDFAAAAQALIRLRYTAPKKLAIRGGSNGGLLMGAQLVQHPELYAAVVSNVGLYDMLRVELSPNGEFNTTEFGTVKDPASFDALYAYSPLHHVEDGRAYPPILMTVGINDGRVEPWQSMKFAARLQAASPAGAPVLLRVAGDAGHGQGMSLSSSIDLEADIYTFLFDRLGMSPEQTAAAPRPIGRPATPALQTQ